MARVDPPVVVPIGRAVCYLFVRAALLRRWQGEWQLNRSCLIDGELAEEWQDTGGCRALTHIVAVM